MGRAEIIDLLSTDDEAQPQTLNADRPRVPASSFVYPKDIGRTGLPQRESKRRKLSPSSSPVGDVSTYSRLPVNASLHPTLAKPRTQDRTEGLEEWTAVDGSDPIVFTSSATAGAVVLRTNRRRSSLPLSEHSEDSLPDDLLSAPVQKSSKASALSQRTATLLASLSRSPQHVKPANPRKQTSDEILSKGENGPRRAVDGAEQIARKSRPNGPAGEVKAQARSKFTEEEKAARDRDREREKAAKAREKEHTKIVSKEQKAREREEDQERKRILKEEKAREKRIAADLAEVNKSKLDKKDSTPEMIVDLPASIDGQSVDTQIREFLKTLGVDATLYQSPLPNVVRWRRKMKARWNADLDHWEPMERMEIHEERHVMCIMSAKEFVALATAQNRGEDIETHVTRLKSAYEGCIPIYLIEGLQSWMRKNKTAENRAYQDRVNLLSQSNTDEVPTASQKASKKKKPVSGFVDEDMIEDALLKLQVMNGSLVHHTNTSVETAEWVANFTQHISTIPYRYC